MADLFSYNNREDAESVLFVCFRNGLWNPITS